MEYTPTELEVFARQQAPQIARAETGDQRAGSGGVCSPGAAGHDDRPDLPCGSGSRPGTALIVTAHTVAKVLTGRVSVPA